MTTSQMNRSRLPRRSARECIEIANQKLQSQNIPFRRPSSDIYRRFVLKETRDYSLTEGDWKRLAAHLGIE